MQLLYFQESENGLYISMCTNPFFGLGMHYVEAFSLRADCPVFLHLKRIKHEVQYCWYPIFVSMLYLLLLLTKYKDYNILLPQILVRLAAAFYW